MKKIVYIADPEIVAIPIEECGEPLVDLKNQNEIAYGPVPECEATQYDYTKMRKSVYQRLCCAQNDLPDGYRFRLYEGYRSLAVQKMLFDDEFERVSKQSVERSSSELFHAVTRLVSPVINFDGSPNIPAHNTGGAVDVEVIDSNGQLVDMGMAVKDTWAVDPDLCLTDSPLITSVIKENRQMLLAVMGKNGFVNYPTEWWHFSYGDRYWAFYQQQSCAIYGSAMKV